MKKLILRFACVCLAATVSAAAQAKKPAAVQAPDSISAAGYLVLADRSYGTDPKHTYDIYLPGGGKTKDVPLLILIHGGGWAAGDKDNYYHMIPGLQALFPGCAYATINYRLAHNGQDQFPAQELDVKACIEHIMRQSVAYGLSGRFALMGGSAGGHLCLLYAYKYACSPRPAAVVDMTGPADLTVMMGQTGSGEYRGWMLDAAGEPFERADVYRSSSPLLYVNPGCPPTLMLYGADDPIVPKAQPEALRRRLEECGVPHVCHIFPGTDHSLSAAGEPAMKAAYAFLEHYLINPAP